MQKSWKIENKVWKIWKIFQINLKKSDALYVYRAVNGLTVYRPLEVRRCYRVIQMLHWASCPEPSGWRQHREFSKKVSCWHLWGALWKIQQYIWAPTSTNLNYILKRRLLSRCQALKKESACASSCWRIVKNIKNDKKMKSHQIHFWSHFW